MSLVFVGTCMQIHTKKVDRSKCKRCNIRWLGEDVGACIAKTAFHVIKLDIY